MDDVTLPTVGLIAEVREQVFRISRLTADTYGVVRVTDNVLVGTFAHSHGQLQVRAENVDVSLMAEIAAIAIRRGL